MSPERFPRRPLRCWSSGMRERRSYGCNVRRADEKHPGPQTAPAGRPLRLKFASVELDRSYESWLGRICTNSNTGDREVRTKKLERRTRIKTQTQTPSS